MKGIHEVLVRRLFASKRMLFILAILVTIGARYAFSYRGVQYIKNMSWEEYNLLPYLIYKKITFWVMISYLFIPMFLFLLELPSSVFDRYKVILKYNSIKQWWRDKIIGTGIISFFYIAVININILGAILLSGHKNIISQDFLMYMLLGGLYQMVGFLIFGVFYHIVVLKTSHKYIGFFITFITMALLQALDRGLKLNNLITLESYMFLLNKVQLKIVLWDFIPLLSLMLIFILLYGLGSWASSNKDIYWSD